MGQPLCQQKAIQCSNKQVPPQVPQIVRIQEMNKNTYTASETSGHTLWLLAAAFGGGIFAILGTMLEEAFSSSVLMLFLIGPAIEEVMKPIGVILLLESRPYVFVNRGSVILVALASATIFASLENFMYIFIYNPGGSMIFIMYRLIACTLIHLIATFVFTLGLLGDFEDVRAGKKTFELEDRVRYIIAAIGIHSAFNTIVYLLHRFEILAIR